MPSVARRHEDRWRPSLAERLKQSQEDRKTRGARKLKAVPPPEPTEQLIFRTQNELQVITYSSNAAVTAATDAITINTITGGTVTMNGGTVWRVWNDNSTAACNHYDTGTGAADTWAVWYQMPVRQYVNEWGRWVDTPVIQRVVHGIPQDGFERFRVTETEEEKKLRLEQEARWRREEDERQRKLREADAKAMELLNSCLSREQQECLRNNGYFFVKAKSGRLYRIDHGSHGNVKVVDPVTKKVTERLCIQPDGVPFGDSMLAQKLFIEAAEDVFRQHANITLNDGQIIRGAAGLLTGDKLAPVIPIRRAA